MIVILHADDDPNDRLLVKLAFDRAKLPVRYMEVDDGFEAIKYLKGEGRFVDRNGFPFPQLLLLDLKMPRKSGFEVMDWIRQQPQFPGLPVVVLTSSADESDRRRAIEKGAQSYIVKPYDLSDLSDCLIKQLSAILWPFAYNAPGSLESRAGGDSDTSP